MKKKYINPAMACSELSLQTFMNTLSNNGLYVGEGDGEIGGDNAFVRPYDNDVFSVWKGGTMNEEW